MSKFTTELRCIVENAEIRANGSYEEFEYTSAAWAACGLDSYPIYDEAHRSELNRKIIDHYYMREIGAETAGLFKLYMRRTMQEIMPYYNALYEARDQITDPMSGYEKNRTESWEIDNTEDWSNENQSTSSSTNENENVYSDTPMSLLSNTGSPSVKNLDYATNVTYDDGSASAQSTGNASGDNKKNEGGHRTVEESGRDKSQAALYEEYRKAWDNIDLMVIDDLAACFMQVY